MIMIKSTSCSEFIQYCLAIEIDEKGHTDRDLEFFLRKGKKH